MFTAALSHTHTRTRAGVPECRCKYESFRLELTKPTSCQFISTSKETLLLLLLQLHLRCAFNLQNPLGTLALCCSADRNGSKALKELITRHSSLHSDLPERNVVITVACFCDVSSSWKECFDKFHQRGRGVKTNIFKTVQTRDDTHRDIYT